MNQKVLEILIPIILTFATFYFIAYKEDVQVYNQKIVAYEQFLVSVKNNPQLYEGLLDNIRRRRGDEQNKYPDFIDHNEDPEIEQEEPKKRRRIFPVRPDRPRLLDGSRFKSLGIACMYLSGGVLSLFFVCSFVWNRIVG